MTDTLRTRIAAITASLIREEIDIDPVWLVAQHVADAVIRELKQQWRADYGYDGYQNCDTRDEAAERVASFNGALGDDWQDGEQAMVMRRYVTEWAADD